MVGRLQAPPRTLRIACLPSSPALPQLAAAMARVFSSGESEAERGHGEERERKEEKVGVSVCVCVCVFMCVQVRRVAQEPGVPQPLRVVLDPSLRISPGTVLPVR